MSLKDDGEYDFGDIWDEAEREVCPKNSATNSWNNRSFAEENEYDIGEIWSEAIAEEEKRKEHCKKHISECIFEEQTIDDAEVFDDTLFYLNRVTNQKTTIIDRLFGFEKDIPICNFDEYAFSDRETVKAAQYEYAAAMKSHIIKKAKTKLIIIFMIIILISCIIVGFYFYNKGFLDNQPYAQDSSPIVVITKSGSKYHRKTCNYVDTGIEISREQAKNQGFSPCSVCKPHKLK